MTSPVPPESLAELYAEHARRLHHYLARRAGVEVADDLVAEAFLIFWEKRAEFDDHRASAKTWLYGIATNLMRNHVRAEERRLKAWTRHHQRSGTAEDVGSRAAETVDAGALAGRLSAELAALRPEDRDVLLLTAWADLTPSEIAAATGVSVGNVRVRLFRVRAKLRDRVRSLHTETPSQKENGHA